METGTIALVVFGGVIVLFIAWGIGVGIYNKSRGTISIILDNYQFNRGEKVTGKVVVNLKKVIHGQKLTVSLIETKETRELNVNSTPTKINSAVSFQSTQNTRDFSQTLFNFEMPIAGENDYLQGEYPFQIAIPQDQANTGLGQVGSTIVGVIKTIESANSRTTWIVQARLYIPGKPDLSGRIQINVT